MSVRHPGSPWEEQAQPRDSPLEECRLLYRIPEIVKSVNSGDHDYYDSGGIDSSYADEVDLDDKSRSESESASPIAGRSARFGSTRVDRSRLLNYRSSADAAGERFYCGSGRYCSRGCEHDCCAIESQRIEFF